jgi:hypothetical protein
MEKQWTYLQYFKDLDLPIYVRLDLSEFDSHILTLLNKMNFAEIVEQKDIDEIHLRINKEGGARLLTFAEASSKVARQIDLVAESDRFGHESIVPKENYNVYRYKGMSLMVYAFSAPEWQIACYPDFGIEADVLAARSVMNRFLSWSLSSLGYVGFWGVPVDEGMVVLRQSDSEGEAVFLDVRRKRMLTLDGHRKMNSRFNMIKLDSAISGKNLRMSNEELLSFLSQYCTYFDYNGLSIPVRQLIQTIVQNTEGLLHPKDSFKPRTDLSL